MQQDNIYRLPYNPRKERRSSVSMGRRQRRLQYQHQEQESPLCPLFRRSVPEQRPHRDNLPILHMSVC